MNFNEYQKKSAEFDLYKKTSDLKSPAFIEKVLGLTGEAGETADKIKKLLRDQDGQASPEDKAAIKKELGDVLWYIANVARYLDVDLDDVATTNLEKLSSRKTRQKLHGSGDDR